MVKASSQALQLISYITPDVSVFSECFLSWVPALLLPRLMLAIQPAFYH